MSVQNQSKQVAQLSKDTLQEFEIFENMKQLNKFFHTDPEEVPFFSSAQSLRKKSMNSIDRSRTRGFR